MIGRRATAGLSLLCALLFCALAAQSASAAKAANTTAFTCVKGGGEQDFKDAHCDQFVGSKKGEFGHVAIANDTTTEIELNNETTGGAKITSILKFTLGGVVTEIACKTATTAKEKSFIHNVESEGKHTVTGTAALLFSECEVKKPTKCTVKEPIEMRMLFEGVEGLGANKDTMGLEFKPDPEEMATLAEITFQDKGAEKCALGGKTFSLFGPTIGTGTPSPKEKHSGSTYVFEAGNEMQKAESGGSTGGGIGGSITSTFTMRMAGGNPVSLTTTT
jgi:hypothetical protein